MNLLINKVRLRFILSGFLLLISSYKINAQIFVETDLNQGIEFVSRYIASEEFEELRRKDSEVELVDSIYLNTLRFYKYDYSETLLALAFGTLPYNKMPITIPFFEIPLEIPLPSVPDSLFNIKWKNIPSHILPDSPKNEFGDKDKLAHFFGNAFLSYNVSFFKLSDFMSIFVEVFERTLKVEGSIDQRDLHVNSLGKLFGKALRSDNQILPSHFLKQSNNQ